MMLSNLAKSNRLPQLVLLSGRYTQNPFDRTGAAPLPAEQFLENCVFFVPEKQPTSIAIGWSEHARGRESSVFSRGTIDNNRNIHEESETVNSLLKRFLLAYAHDGQEIHYRTLLEVQSKKGARSLHGERSIQRPQAFRKQKRQSPFRRASTILQNYQGP